MYRLHLIIPIIVLAALLTGVVAVSLIAVNRPSGERSPVVSSTSAIHIQTSLHLPTSVLHYNQPVVATILVTNTGVEAYHYIFPTACTDPVFLLDGQLLAINRFCAEQQTPLSLDPGQQQVFTVTFNPVDPKSTLPDSDSTSYAIPTGEHQLQAVWADRASEGVTINVQQ